MPPKESNQNGDMELMRSLMRFNQKPVPVIDMKNVNIGFILSAELVKIYMKSSSQK